MFGPLGQHLISGLLSKSSKDLLQPEIAHDLLCPMTTTKLIIFQLKNSWHPPSDRGIFPYM